jgi:hypothetical protein
MRVKRILILFIVFAFIIGAGFFILNDVFKKKLASLQVNSNLNLPVLVDGEEVGTSPFEGTFEPKEVVVKIGNYETKVTLQDRIKTIINRKFSSDLGNSYGETLSFEKTGLKDSIIAVATNPGGADITLDQKLYGVSPVNMDNMPEGKYKLSISFTDYEKDEFFIKSFNGYKLTVFADLMPLRSQKTEEVASESGQVKTSFVKILSTPNGFLRVRREPNTTSSEIGRVHEGERYEFIGKDTKTNWFNIKVASQSGWISDTYAVIEN